MHAVGRCIAALGPVTLAAFTVFAAGCPTPVAGAAGKPLEAGDAAFRVKEIIGSKVMVVFVPRTPSGDTLRDDPRLLEFALDHGFSIGLVSGALGRDVPPAQTYLDLGQGARVDQSLYESMPRGAGRILDGRMVAFSALGERASKVPAKVRPGLLGEELTRAGVRVAYVGDRSQYQPAALAAADRDGRVHARLASRGGSEAVAALAEWQWRHSRAVFVALPDASYGVLNQLTRLAGGEDLVIYMGTPEAGSSSILPVAVRTPSISGGDLTSSATRTTGLVAATDLAPTILDFLGVKPPSAMTGKRITSHGDADAGRLERLEKRLTVVASRRLAALGGLAAAVAAVFLILAVARGRRGLILAVRVTALAVFWLPAVLLATAALEPAAWAELVLLVAGCIGLSAITAWFLRGPSALLVAAGASLAALTIDLALGSPLTRVSLLGPNPAYGARFFGLGNELEGVMVVMCLLALGMALDIFGLRYLTGGFLAGGAAFAVVVGWSRLGADVGGVVMLGAGVAVAALLASRRASSGRPGVVAAMAAFGSLVGLFALITLDIVLGSGAHLSDAITGGGGEGGLSDAIERRLELNLGQLERPSTTVFVLLVAALGMAGWLKRRTLITLLDRWPAMRAAVAGSLVAIAVGIFVNDSGGVILIGGASVLLPFLAYVAVSDEEGNHLSHA